MLFGFWFPRLLILQGASRRNGRALHALILISEALSVKGGEIIVVEHGDPAATWSRSNRSILSQFTEKSCLIGTPWA
jgi:hypothetical protein